MPLRVHNPLDALYVQPDGHVYTVSVLVDVQQYVPAVHCDVHSMVLIHVSCAACADVVCPIASNKPTFRFGKERGIKNAEIWD